MKLAWSIVPILWLLFAWLLCLLTLVMHAGFVALLRGAGEREQAARQEARHWHLQAIEWQQK